MGKQIREKECALPNRNSHHTHPGRVWGILHVIKYHHWRQVKRRLTHRRHGGERLDASTSKCTLCSIHINTATYISG